MAFEKKLTVRAFCTETSMPNTGASGARTTPRIWPRVSTTEMVTWARLSSGRRIWPRALLMTMKASSSIARTSAAVSGVGFSLASVPSRIGKRFWPAPSDSTMALGFENSAAVASRRPEASVP